MRQTRSKVKTVLEAESDGISYKKGDAVLLQDKTIGIISEFLHADEEITANIHEFTTQEMLNRMEFRNKKLKVLLDKHEILYNSGRSKSYFMHQIAEKIVITQDSKNSNQDYFCKRSLDIDRGYISEVSWDIVKNGRDLLLDSPVKGVKKVYLDDDTLKNSSALCSESDDSSDSNTEQLDEEYKEDQEQGVEEEEESVISDESEQEETVQESESDDIDDIKPIQVKRKKVSNNSRLDKVRAMARPVVKHSIKYGTNNMSVPQVIPRNATIYQKARNTLYLSYTPESLPCRETEFDEIYTFLEELINARSGACIYISGVPGTGKTATVLSVINALQREMGEKKFPYCQCIEINGMKLTEPTQAYQVLWEGLTGNKVSSSHALELLTKRFSNSSSHEPPCIVLMDELDLLLTKNQKVIYNFFDWPNKPNSKLIVLAIANTMDLPERTLSNKVASRLEMKRITFQPYSFDQLVEIVESRLAAFNIFSPDAIQLCARKVGSISGDARRALAICRRAIELFEESNLTPKKENISMELIQKVITEMYSGPAQQSIRKASLHQRIFLCSIFRASRVNGIQEVEFAEVCNEHSRICQLQGIFCPTGRDLVSVASFLSSFHLIHCETNKMGTPNQKMRLIVSEEDLIMALKCDKENEFLQKILNV